MTTKGSIQQEWSEGRAREIGTCRLDVQLKPTWIENVGYRYDVILDGETIVSQSRDPEYDAARVLHARGLRGKFRTIDFRTGRPRMQLDIAKAAGLRTIDRNDAGPPTVGPFRPMSDDDRARARPHSLHQGRLFRDGTVQSTPEGFEGDGGEGVDAARQPHDCRDSRRLRDHHQDKTPDHPTTIHGNARIIPPEPDADAGVRLESEEA